MPPHSPRAQHPDEVIRLAALLKRLQEASGMSQEELGERLNRSRSAINRYLNGVEVLPKESLDEFLDLTRAGAADRQEATRLMGVITGAVKPVLTPVPAVTPDTPPDVAIDMPEPTGHPPTEQTPITLPSTTSAIAPTSAASGQPGSSTAEPSQPPELAAGHPPQHEQGDTSRDNNTGLRTGDEPMIPTADGELGIGGATSPPPQPIPEVVPAIPDEDRASRPNRRRLILIAGGAVSLVVVTVLVTALVIEWLRAPQRKCAIVATSEDRPAPVYLEIGQRSETEKRHGERVEIYQELEPTDTPEGRYVSVFLREDGKNTYGWMLERHLRPAAACSP